MRNTVVVVGTGIAGQSHVFDAIVSNLVEPAGVVSLHSENAKATASQFGIPHAFDSLTQALNVCHPDGVIIATPPHVMDEMLTICHNAKVFAICEKPGPLLSDRSAYQNAAFANDIIALPRRYRSVWRYAKQLLSDKQTWRQISMFYIRQAPFHQYFSRNAKTFRGNLELPGRGTWYDFGSHALDALFMLRPDLRQSNIKESRVNWSTATQCDLGGHLRLLNETTDCTIELLDAIQESEVLSIDNHQGKTITIENDKLMVDRQQPSVDKQSDALVVDDIWRYHAGKQPMGLAFSESLSYWSVISTILRPATTPSWERPRARAIARPSGAC